MSLELGGMDGSIRDRRKIKGVVRGGMDEGGEGEIMGQQEGEVDRERNWKTRRGTIGIKGRVDERVTEREGEEITEDRRSRRREKRGG
jgi:hypothetical protein